MFKIIFALLFFYTMSSYAMSCRSDADCNQWEQSNCVCGVYAKCNGLTAQNPNGNCQCNGASGSCVQNDNTEASTYYGEPRRAGAVRRGIRRGAVRNNSDVQSVEITR